MRFALLASGSKGNSCIIYDENMTLMIDCRTTKNYLTRAMAEVGTTVEDLDAVLVTHTHSDHISQIRMVKDCRIYSPERLTVPSAPVIPEKPFQINHVTVTPLALSHDTDITVGYVLRSWKEKLVYITDTGYLKDSYLPLLKDADYILLESNHDIEMLMHTSRPPYLKMRIASDNGHLCNENCANILANIVSVKTKHIVLSHISQEANTPQKALEVNCTYLREHCPGRLHPQLVVTAAQQYEIIKGGDWHEKSNYGVYRRYPGMERMADI